MEQNTTQVFSAGTQSAPQRSVDTPLARRFGYLVAILVNGALLYVFHHLATWGAPYITEDWALVLPAFDLSLGATMLANMAYYSYDPAWFRHLGQIGLNVLGLRAMYAVLVVFPLNLEPHIAENVLRLSIIVMMAAVVIATLVELVSLLVARVNATQV